MAVCLTCYHKLDESRHLLGYTTCILCSAVKPVKAGLNYAHKTAGEIDIMPAGQWNKYKRVVNRTGKRASNMSRTARGGFYSQ
jgi:hypothetical protein